MGASNSKQEKTNALKLCKQRNILIKQAMDSRLGLAAAHISYIQSLRQIGISLRRFAEAEVLVNESSSLSPSHTSYPSPSPSNMEETGDSVSDSPVRTRLSYMRIGGSESGPVALTFRYNPTTNVHSVVDDEGVMGGFVLPPPPPPPPDCAGVGGGVGGDGGGDGGAGDGWDYFDAENEKDESFRFVGVDDVGPSESVRLWGDDVGHKEKEKELTLHVKYNTNSGLGPGRDGSGLETDLGKKEKDEGSSVKKDVDVCDEREDPSEFITHRAKDFLSSIKDIEHRFFKASESGKEVARMLEGNKIRVGYAEAKGNSSKSDLLVACPLVCCRGKNGHASHDTGLQQGPKVIIWNRSMSSQSSSSRNPLASASKDDGDDSGSECVEDFCMISGSHSSTLDRLYAWERKLYDEVKASEVIRKAYDRKCTHLRHQFAKDQSVHVMDKTRSAIKDLHSRMRVALHAVNTIAKRIEKMRDDELQPQLNELIQGFIRMWKAMLECHHAQYITISLAYHARNTMGSPRGDARKQIMAQLQYEFECFGVSFANWINCQESYVEALNGWLQCCVIQPQERSRSRRPFSPRRFIAPPIFVLCRDWSVGIKSLPSKDVNDAIRNFLSDLHQMMKQNVEEKKDKECSDNNGDSQVEVDKETNDGKSGNLGSIHTSMTKVLDKLTKFSEASLKLYEDIKQKAEAARVAYISPRPYRY